MGDGYPEQERSIVLDTGRSNRGHVGIQLDVDEGCCRRILTQMDQARGKENVVMR